MPFLSPNQQRQSTGTLSQTPDLVNFATASRSRCQQNSSSSEFVDDTCTTVDESWLLTTSWSTVTLTTLLPFVVDLLYQLFLQLTRFWLTVCLSVFSCTVLFVSSSQVIGCVEWGVKLYSNQPTDSSLHGPSVIAELVNLILCYINIYSLTGFLVVGLWIGFDFRLF